jgi:hypothetical protein
VEFVKSPSNLYPNWTFDQCPQKKKLSASCNTFHEYQECSFGCDANPIVSKTYSTMYGVANVSDSSTSFPLCAAYCDEWFDACADDFTCWADWSSWPQDNGRTDYGCDSSPRTECKTYRDYYKDGKGLCEGIFSKRAYSYSTDASTCLSMGPSLKGACLPGLPNPKPAGASCKKPAEPAALRADGSTSGSCAVTSASNGFIIAVTVGPIAGAVVIATAAYAFMKWRVSK